jgi:hypothetical protein
VPISISATNILPITATPHIPVVGVIRRSATAIPPTSSPVNEEGISVEFTIAYTGNSIYGGVDMHTTKAYLDRNTKAYWTTDGSTEHATSYVPHDLTGVHSNCIINLTWEGLGSSTTPLELYFTFTSLKTNIGSADASSTWEGNYFSTLTTPSVNITQMGKWITP